MQSLSIVMIKNDIIMKKWNKIKIWCTQMFQMPFGGLMRLFKNIFALLLTGVMTVNMGCGMHNETSRKIIRKERDEVEADVEAYLEEKYAKAFMLAF